MADDTAVLSRRQGVRQAVAGLLLVPALCAGLWVLGETVDSNGVNSAKGPASCSDGEPEKAPVEPGQVPVTGTQLCEVLNRPDLAELLGTPTEPVKSAHGSDSSFGIGDEKVATPSAEVEIGTYTVTLSATYDDRPVGGEPSILWNDAQRRKLLGRPAVLYSDRTISIRFRLDGSDAQTGPGVPTRTVVVARDAKDSGGSFEVTLWRQDGWVPDDAVLLDIAEKVLPTVPGWSATG
ncbi:DUF6215 domain-containing protein [Streptomyces sp. NBC_01353]|uniref:DUF6215 domain-containing protein n=1 Tax=Streptomyces sp. NBC_01353 TaxID=2903835 RepID=UPI002E2F0006|nr:DUF6215 domain-containing protein [Streptomyces sp. NBC_01353]